MMRNSLGGKRLIRTELWLKSRWGRWETLIVHVLYVCLSVSSFLGEHSEMAQDRLPLIVGSALGGLAFLVIAAIAILAIIFKR